MGLSQNSFPFRTNSIAVFAFPKLDRRESARQMEQ
jgi:hypothetical protein